MGRLQRKKTPAAKKKKKLDSSAKSASLKKDPGVSKTSAVFGGSSKNNDLKTVPSKKILSVNKKAESGKIKTFFDNCIQFLREVRVELKKVAWPSRKQTMGSTVVVIILILIISSFLGLVDISLASLIRVIIQ